MTIKNILYIYLLFLVVSNISCQKAKNNAEPRYAYNLKNFPLNINDQWRYKVTDFYYNSIDTITLKVVNKIQNNDSEIDWRCNIYDDSLVIDSGLFRQINDRLSYDGLNPNYSYFGNLIFSFPITPNSYWIGDYAVDTVRLISIDSNITIQSKTYENVFYIKRAFNLIGNYGFVQTIQLSKNVGIISQSLYVSNGGLVQNQDFELIDYVLY